MWWVLQKSYVVAHLCMPCARVFRHGLQHNAQLKFECPLATEHGLKQKLCSQVLGSFVAIAAKEVKSAGVFTVPGVCRIKTRVKPATKAGVRMMFGKETKVAAKPAKTVVKAFAVAALKKQI